MTVNSPNMSLSLWEAPLDTFSHVQLYQNFLAIDAHNHTSGQGVQIPSAGIANQAITAAQIANATITANQIAAGAIGTSQLAAGAVTGSQIAAGAVGPSQIASHSIGAASLAGAPTLKYTLQNSPYTANNGDFVLMEGNNTITLPAPAANLMVGAVCTGATCTLATNGGFIITGGLFLTSAIVGNCIPVVLYCDGELWWPVGGSTQTQWGIYAPSWVTTGSQPAIGNGTLIGFQTQIGGIMYYTISFTAGSTTTFGTGNWSFTLPTEAYYPPSASGFASYNGSSIASCTAYSTQNSFYVSPITSGGYITASAPGAWTNGGTIVITGLYQTY